MDDNSIERAFEQLKQVDMIKSILANGDHSWTVVYDSWDNEDTSGRSIGAMYVVFAQPDQREKIVSHPDFDFWLDDGCPDLLPVKHDGEEIVAYHRNKKAPAFEPLVTLQKFEDVVPDVWVVSEEFCLLMNLWRNPENGHYYEINNEISEEPVIRITDKKVEVYTSILRRYQAARQLDLVLFADFGVYVQPCVPDELLHQLRIEEVMEDGLGYKSQTAATRRTPDGKRKSSSRVIIKRILPPFPLEACGIGKFASKGDYPEFIIDKDDDGNLIRYTCNPDELSNVENPNAPGYLAPVYFKKGVLQHYLDNPKHYTVTDTSLECAKKWKVKVIDGGQDSVSVALGEIGRYIPPEHWLHWQTYNIPPID